MSSRTTIGSTSLSSVNAWERCSVRIVPVMAVRLDEDDEDTKACQGIYWAIHLPTDVCSYIYNR